VSAKYKTMAIQTHTLDAENKALGRLASNIAMLLMGKDTAAFERHEAQENKVLVTNASKLKISEKQLKDRVYTTFSGYPSGQRYENMGETITKKGYGEVIRIAVFGMLPHNRLRNGMMKRLTIKD